MYQLVANVDSPDWMGEVARESFASIKEAEQTMAKWAKYGIDDYCNEPDTLHIVDAAGVEVRCWDWRLKRSLAPAAATSIQS